MYVRKAVGDDRRFAMRQHWTRWPVMNFRFETCVDTLPERIRKLLVAAEGRLRIRLHGGGTPHATFSTDHTTETIQLVESSLLFEESAINTSDSDRYNQIMKHAQAERGPRFIALVHAGNKGVSFGMDHAIMDGMTLIKYLQTTGFFDTITTTKVPTFRYIPLLSEVYTGAQCLARLPSLTKMRLPIGRTLTYSPDYMNRQLARHICFKIQKAPLSSRRSRLMAEWGTSVPFVAVLTEEIAARVGRACNQDTMTVGIIAALDSDRNQFNNCGTLVCRIDGLLDQSSRGKDARVNMIYQWMHITAPLVVGSHIAASVYDMAGPGGSGIDILVSAMPLSHQTLQCGGVSLTDIRGHWPVATSMPIFAGAVSVGETIYTTLVVQCPEFSTNVFMDQSRDSGGFIDRIRRLLPG
jgi:hypothetical protein